MEAREAALGVGRETPGEEEWRRYQSSIAGDLTTILIIHVVVVVVVSAVHVHPV